MSNLPVVLNCRGRALSLVEPCIMGIINTTSDSFYAPSRKTETSAAVDQAGLMLTEGATILDIGGMSTRPGSELLTAQQESDNLLPVLSALRAAFPEAFISIDTFRSDVAKAAIETGADIINDISGGNLDSGLPQVVADAGVPYIIMHMRGTPQTMASFIHYEGDIMEEIIDYFFRIKYKFNQLGIGDLIIDPGFGFAKTTDQNYIILKRLAELKIIGLPVLAGLSRKGMFWKPLNSTPENILPATVAAHFYALQQGASILRVHDVEAAVQARYVWQQLQHED